jgi:hypothetical protein
MKGTYYVLKGHKKDIVDKWDKEDMSGHVGHKLKKEDVHVHMS